MAPPKTKDELTYSVIKGVDWISVPYDQKDAGMDEGKWTPSKIPA